MAEDRVNPTTNPQTEEEYEYEYVELAEGEELPEGAEYEYEYVEVPVDEAEISEVVGQTAPETNIESLAEKTSIIPEFSEVAGEEDIPSFFREEDQAELNDEPIVYEPIAEVDSNGEILEEPHWEIAAAEELPVEELKEPHFEPLTVAEPISENLDSNEMLEDDFLNMDSGDLSLDDILDNDSPLANMDDFEDVDFEKSLFGTPEPDLHLEEITELAEEQILGGKVAFSESVKEPEAVVETVVEDIESDEVAEVQSLPEVTVDTVLSEPEDLLAESSFEERIEPIFEENQESVIVPEIDAEFENKGEPDIISEDKEIFDNEVMTEEFLSEPEPEPEPELIVSAEEISADAVPMLDNGAEVSAGEVMQVLSQSLPAENVELEIENELDKSPDIESEVETDFEIAEESDEFSESSVVEDEVESEFNSSSISIEDYQPEEKNPDSEFFSAVCAEEVSIIGAEEEELVPLPEPKTATETVSEKAPTEFVQTDEVPVEVSLVDIVEEDYALLSGSAFSFNKAGGFQSFQADEKLYNLIVEDIDDNTHEAQEWSLVIFDDYRLRLNPQEKELLLPKADNVVRYAKILKAGKTRLELFNEQQYNFMAPTEEFVKIRGHYIYGNIANNSKLIVKDFVNLSLNDKAGKQICFNKPVSGLLIGPKAAKLYFCDVRAVIVPSVKQVRQDRDREQSRAARWYSGSSQDDRFEFDAKMPSTIFNGTENCKIIHVNVGISNYGWNITFDNGLFMSFRDLQEYQTRYGQLPASSGVITHGQQTLKFNDVEKIVVYEAAQYFTYG